MDFNFTEEQKILKETARDFLAAECPSSFVLEMEEDEIGYTPELWRKMAELGWMGLIIPEEYEGVGGGFLDLIVMLEEMGRACLPGPFFSTVVLGATSIMEAGNESQLKEYLGEIATGEIKLTLAHSEPCFTRYDPYLIEVTASPEGSDYILKGTKLFVPDAHVADYMICVARTGGSKRSKEGISLFLVDAKSRGVKCTALKTISGDKQFEVAFEDVKVPKNSVLGEVNKGGEHLARILEKASICKCAEMLGGAQKVLDMASAYAKEREQFGKAIGSFQAVQHHCANMLMDIDGSRYITYKVAWMLRENIRCAKEVAVAKAWTGDAYKRVVGLGHQVLGATGYIIEHDMPLYSRRAKAAEIAFGDSNYCRQVVAQELGL
jgi:alkylation response protein AidB-like acyl-CoA dehydrogenase